VECGGRPVTVVIVDQHPAVVAGVRSWCAAADPPILVVGAGPTPEVVTRGAGADADVVVVDQPYPAVQRLVEDGRRVVVYTASPDGRTALRCLELNVATYLTKAEGPEHLIPALRAAARDLPYISPALGGVIAADRRPGRPALSEREREVLLAWFENDSKNLVAERLNLSVKTIDTYIARVRIKYAEVGRPASTKAALVARALQDGLVDLSDL
jgi:DNA-binding NarL/FixJ family response regulator